METDPTNRILTQGLEISQFYYRVQRYFGSLILAAEGVAHRLADLGWRITTWNYGRPVHVGFWSWSENRNALLPKRYLVLFERGSSPPCQAIDVYGLVLWFFTSDPSGLQPWVPMGFFFRVTPRPGARFEEWRVVPKIAEEVRPKLLRPQPAAAFLQYREPWPSTLAGDGVDNQLQAINVVPFPLASIATSEDLEAIREHAVRALLEENPDILFSNQGYLQRVWGL